MERSARERGPRWRALLLGIVVLMGLGGCALVFLVLTGIIAEPQTVIEEILRAVTGGR